MKIRGFRIELGEIEAVLNQNVDVQTSCVIAREDIPGEKRLVAYVVPQTEVIPTMGELRQFLKAKLPEYIVPNAFVILGAINWFGSGGTGHRTRTEIEGLIGFFVNSLALRFDLSQEPTFEALLAQVRKVTQNAYDHQDLPFEMLVEELQLERHLDRNPLVQVGMALRKAQRLVSSRSQPGGWECI